MERATSGSTSGSGVADLNRAQFGNELVELVKRVDVWSAGMENALSDTSEIASFIQVFAQEDAKEVMGRLKTLDAEDQFIRKVKDTQQEEFIKCEQETNEIYRSLEDLHDHTTKLFKLEADREALISKSMSDITDKLSHRKQKVKALYEASGWYKRLMSLHCEYSDAVKFIFTNVDPLDLDRVFTFSIRLDKSSASWTMVDCNPWVEASVSFVESLNKNNELSRLVRSMRREFEVLAVRSRYLVK